MVIAMKSRSLQVPVEYKHTLPISSKNPGDVRESHRATCAALV